MNFNCLIRVIHVRHIILIWNPSRNLRLAIRSMWKALIRPRRVLVWRCRCMITRHIYLLQSESFLGADHLLLTGLLLMRSCMDGWKLLALLVPIEASFVDGTSLFGLVVGSRIWISTSQSPAHHAIWICVGRNSRIFLGRDTKRILLWIGTVQEWRVQAILLQYQLAAISLVSIYIDILVNYSLDLGALRDTLTWHSFAPGGCSYELPALILVATVVLSLLGWILVQGRNSLALLDGCVLHAFFVLYEVGKVGLD